MLAGKFQRSLCFVTVWKEEAHMKHSLHLPITEDKKVHTGLYRLSLFTWLANIALIVINLFVDLSGISFICLFASVFLQVFLLGVISKTA